MDAYGSNNRTANDDGHWDWNNSQVPPGVHNAEEHGQDTIGRNQNDYAMHDIDADIDSFNHDPSWEATASENPTTFGSGHGHETANLVPAYQSNHTQNTECLSLQHNDHIHGRPDTISTGILALLDQFDGTGLNRLTEATPEGHSTKVNFNEMDSIIFGADSFNHDIPHSSALDHYTHGQGSSMASATGGQQATPLVWVYPPVSVMDGRSGAGYLSVISDRDTYSQSYDSGSTAGPSQYTSNGFPALNQPWIFGGSRESDFDGVQKPRMLTEGHTVSESGSTMTYTTSLETLDLPMEDRGRRGSSQSLQEEEDRSLLSSGFFFSGQPHQQLEPTDATGLPQSTMPTLLAGAPGSIADTHTINKNNNNNNNNNNSDISSTIPAALASKKQRGRRKGPLNDKKRKQTAETRQSNSVCIGCSRSKIQCEKTNKQDVCQKCMNRGSKGNESPEVCTLANFYHIIQTASIHTITQDFIYHMSMDGHTRERLPLSHGVDMQALRNNILCLSQHFSSLQVKRGEIALYELDLEPCHAYLVDMAVSKNEETFRSVIEGLGKRKQRGDKWRSCFVGHEHLLRTSNLERLRLVEWTSLPGRETYCLIPRYNNNSSGGSANIVQPLYLNGATNLPVIQAAVQLSTILIRKLELAVYHELHQALPKRKTRGNPVAFYKTFSHILLALRERVSWQMVLAKESTEDEDKKEKDVSRIRDLAFIFYMYYCADRRYLKSRFIDISCLEGRTRSSSVVGFEREEMYPISESEAGFEVWMAEGLHNAYGIAEQLRQTGYL